MVPVSAIATTTKTKLARLSDDKGRRLSHDQLQALLEEIGWRCNDGFDSEWTVYVRRDERSVIGMGKDRREVWAAVYSAAIE